MNCDEIADYRVQIIYKEKAKASGVVVKLNEFPNDFFVFTAKHTFGENIERDKVSIVYYGDKIDFKSYIALSVDMVIFIFDNSALASIESIEKINISSKENSFTDAIFTGYPNNVDGAFCEKCEYHEKIADNLYRILPQKNSDSYSKKGLSNSKGYSGSGVFVSSGFEYELVGIIKEHESNKSAFHYIALAPLRDEIIEKIKNSGCRYIAPKRYRELTLPPPINENFVGRKKELAIIAENFKNSRVVSVINGIGGLGKSELSYHYFHKHKCEYNNIIFIKLIDEQTFKETMFFHLKDELYLDENANFQIMIKLLRKYKKQNLLLLDNLQNAKELELLEPLKSNFHILVTTRSKPDNTAILNLKTLNNDDAKELFLSIYPTDENIDDILKYLDNHPLFIKLTAYSLKEEYMELDEVTDSELPEIDSTDDKTFKEHLQRTFDRQFQSQSRDELKELLQILAIFPAVEIDLKILEQVIGRKRLKPKLQKLVNQGWLIRKDKSYKLHQIIKLFILEEYMIEYTEITYILENIRNCIDFKYSSEYITIINSILELFGDNRDEFIAKLLDSNSYLYNSLWEYDNALKMQKKSLIIKKELYDEKSELIADSYGLLGNIYNSQGRYDKAEPFYQKALKIREEILRESHPDIALSYNNLANLYNSKGEYEQAESLYKKTLKIREEILRENHPDIASSYNNLAFLYNSKGEYNKAELLYQKALKIREEILGENHPDTATSYNNLAVLYINIKQCAKAKEYLEKAIASVEKLEYFGNSLIDLRRVLKDVEKSIKREKKLKFNKRGRYCK